MTALPCCKGGQGRGSERWVPHRGQVPAIGVRAGLRDKNKTLCPGRAGERRREAWVIRVIPARGWQAPAPRPKKPPAPLPWLQAPQPAPASPPPRLCPHPASFLTRASGRGLLYPVSRKARESSPPPGAGKGGHRPLGLPSWAFITIWEPGRDPA